MDSNVSFKLLCIPSKTLYPNPPWNFAKTRSPAPGSLPETTSPSPRRALTQFAASVPPETPPLQQTAILQGISGVPWSARAVVHPTRFTALKAIPRAAAMGFTTACAQSGAHEVLIENPRHDGHIWNATDAEIAQGLLLIAQRIQDLKRDGRFKYISVFKNYGASAGQEFEHPNFQLTATTFVPAPRALRDSRLARIFPEQRTLRFLRHHRPGNATRPAGPRSAGRFPRRFVPTLRASPMRRGSFRESTKPPSNASA